MVRKKILEKLQTGFVRKQSLIESVIGECGVTIQAVYKELKKLKSEGVVIDKGQKLSLTLWYINHQLEKWKSISHFYSHTVDVNQIFNIERGKSSSFTFNNLAELDAFWTQSYLFLERVIPETIPTYTCVPHDWFFYSRPLSDERWTYAQSRVQRLIVTHPAEIDLQVLKHRRKQGYQFTPSENPLKQSEITYYTFIGDWIFEVNLDQKIGRKLNNFVSDVLSIKEIDQVNLDELLSEKGVFKLKVYNNPKKAKLLTNKLKKYFD